ncbi:MAG: hypothetical protein DME05_14570 [Candidatus Rokuibacteriota bacterium]|nr:MAG: hypothetical protein DME05_14570 [Candidatus Rokubacteria bacterium]
MQLDPQTIGTEAMYKLMIGCVVPRPIAWVSSVDASGVPNLAPFSYFMAITHDPPTIAFSASPRAEAGGAIRTPCATSRPHARLPSNLVIGQIVHLHVRDDVYDPASGRLDMHRLRPVGRLAGHLYTHVHEIFEMKRPAVGYKG